MNNKFLITIIGRILQIAVTLMSVRVFTTILSTAEVGNVYLINSIVAFFGLALVNPVGMYMTRKIHKWFNENTIIRHFQIFNGYVSLVAVASILVVCILSKLFGVGSGVKLVLLLPLVMLSVYAAAWNQMVLPTLNLLDFRISYVIFTTLTLVVGLVFSVLATTVVGANSFYWLAGQIVAQLLVTLAAFFYFRSKIGVISEICPAASELNLQNVRRILSFVAPLAITTSLMWLQNQSYRMVVETRIGLEYLGMMGLGFSIAANIAFAAESFIFQLYYPVFYREISIADSEQRAMAWNRMGQLTLPFYAALAILVTCLAPFLSTLLVHQKFSESFVFVVYGAWIEFFRMTAAILTNVAHAEMETRSLIKPYFAGGFLSIIGVYLAAGTRYYQHVIPCVLVVCGAVTLVVMYRDMKKLMRIKVGIHRIMRSILLSLPFLLALIFINQHQKFWYSLAIVTSFGIYFLLTQYRIAKPLLQQLQGK